MGCVFGVSYSSVKKLTNISSLVVILMRRARVR